MNLSSSCLCRRRSRSGYRRTIWPTSGEPVGSLSHHRPYQGETRGDPPYHPGMMVKVLLYGYCTGVAFSRCIAQKLRKGIAFRVLTANNTPDFRTFSDFRKDHLAALAGMFR